MKKSFLKSATFALALLLAMTLLALPSCKSLNTPTLHNAAQHYTTLHHDNSDSVVLRDSVAIIDSTFTSERQRGDTIYRDRIHYRDRIEYRDRWHERIVHDTIIHTDSIVQIVEHPPEKYIPPFYKTSTTILWLILIALFLWFIVRRILSKYL